MKKRRVIQWFGLLPAALAPGRSVAAAVDGRIDMYQTAILILAVVLGVSLWLNFRNRKRQSLGYLYRQKGKRLGKFRITTEVCRIGRHPDNELQLNDKSVSRFHAELIRNQNGTFSVYDSGSKNGIRVGARPVNSGVLREGDLIDVGNVRLKFTRRPRDYNVHQNTVAQERPANRFEGWRRREVRSDFTTRVRLYNDETGWLNGWMRNIGREGAFIETDAKLATRLPLDIVAAIEENKRRKWLHLTAEVVWSDAKGIGVNFTDRDPTTLERILSTVP